MKIFTTKTSEVIILQDNIIRINIFENVTIERIDAIENHKLCKRISKKKKFRYLIDVRMGNITISKEARLFLASKAVSNLRIAEAILTKFLPNIFLINIFIKFNKPQHPTKLFSSEEKAIEWLKEFSLEKETDKT